MFEWKPGANRYFALLKRRSGVIGRPSLSKAVLASVVDGFATVLDILRRDS